MRAYQDLGEFLSALEGEKKLLRIAEPVNSSPIWRRRHARWHKLPKACRRRS
jgi:hypothetical protein